MILSDLSLEGIYFIFTYVIEQTYSESLLRYYCASNCYTKFGNVPK
jgi:hypothetical protein